MMSKRYLKIQKIQANQCFEGRGDLRVKPRISA
jgi:hypothetical protein